MRATKVNAGLAESNGRLLLGIWRDSLHVTCGLTACTPGSAPGPALGNEYGKTLPLPLPSGLWLTSPAGWLQRTGISSGSLRSVIEYGLPLPYLNNCGWCWWCYVSGISATTGRQWGFLPELERICGWVWKYLWRILARFVKILKFSVFFVLNILLPFGLFLKIARTPFANQHRAFT